MKIVPRKYQVDGIEKLKQKIYQGKKRILLSAPTGCVDGDTIIRVNRAKTGYFTTIKKEWHNQTVHKKRRSNQITMVRGLTGKGGIGLIESGGVVHSGFKDCIKLTTENNRTLILTPEHLIHTVDGWIKACDMLGKSVAIDSPYPQKTKSKKKIHDNYVSKLNHHPFASIVNSKRDGPYKKIEIHRAIYEAHLNNLSLDEYKKILRTDEAVAKTLKYINPKIFHIHHIDNDHYNNDIKNLEAVEINKHALIHADESYLYFSQGVISWEIVTKIESVGIREVFDVVDTPTKSFTANDIVVHNSGKGLIMAMIANMGLQKGSKALTILYGSDLIYQTDNNYQRYFNINSSIIMGKSKQYPHKSIIASISTLQRRELPEATFLIVDECHQSLSASYQRIFEHYKDLIIIGLSATPFNGLHNFEDYVILSTVKELIKDNYLVQPRHFAPKNLIDTSNLKKVKGEWLDEDLEREALKVTGDILNEWKSKASDRKTIVFCVNVEHSVIMAQVFTDSGIKAIHLDGNTSDEIRQQALQDINTDKLQVICNVNIFSTGVDCPIISCVVMARPTNSEILYIQQAGRGLRTHPNKSDCIILDHANNISRFGLLTDDRLPNLEKKSTKKKQSDLKADEQIWTCHTCYAVNAQTESICQDCKTPRPIKKKSVKTDKGNLSEITNFEVRKKQAKIYYFDTMPFGKYKGTKFKDMPLSYLEWFAKQDTKNKQLQKIIILELESRKKVNGVI